MLEIRYIKTNGKVTAWCANKSRFGKLDRGRSEETTTILDIPIPDKPLKAWLYNNGTQSLVANPDYIKPAPPKDFAAEIDELRARLGKLES